MGKNSVFTIEGETFVAQSGAHAETLGAEAMVIEPDQRLVVPFL